MRILNWPHTLQQTIAKLWLKAVSSASLQNWLCCSSTALHFQHSSPCTVLNVCLNKAPKQLPVNTDSENVFQSNILSKKLQSYDCVSWGRPPSFYGITWGLPWPTAVTWAGAAHVSPAACAPAWLPAGQQHPASRASLLPQGWWGHFQGHVRTCSLGRQIPASYPSDRCVWTPKSSTPNLVSSTLPLCTKPALVSPSACRAVLPTDSARAACRDHTCKIWTNDFK